MIGETFYILSCANDRLDRSSATAESVRSLSARSGSGELFENRGRLLETHSVFEENIQGLSGREWIEHRFAKINHSEVNRVRVLAAQSDVRRRSHMPPLRDRHCDSQPLGDCSPACCSTDCSPPLGGRAYNVSEAPSSNRVMMMTIKGLD